MIRIACRRQLGPLGAALVLVGVMAGAHAAETVKIGFIDPLSGPFANLGVNELKSFEFVGQMLGAKQDVKFQFVSFDNKGSPQESVNALRSAIDQGIRYVVQGNGSGAALALSEAVQKHNDRNPGKEVVYLNYAAVDPDLTNDHCSYWHFETDANVAMKIAAIAQSMKSQPEIKKVYILGQNYSFGQQVSRFFKEDIKGVRPDIQIVGDDLHPLGQVKDFAPYIAKIKASGADTVLTGNWGQDLTLLIKAAHDAGLNAAFYTFYAITGGVPTAMAAGVGGPVRMVYIGYNSLPGLVAMEDEFKKKYNDDFYAYSAYNTIQMLLDGFAKAKSTAPAAVAKAMEGLRFKGYQGEVEMRASDHQLQQPLYISEWRKADAKNPYSVENTGYNFQLVKEIPAAETSKPTTCKMKRP